MSECLSRNQLAQLAAGELPNKEQFALEAHLTTCANCARHLDRIKGHFAEYAEVFDARHAELEGRMATILAGAQGAQVISLAERRPRRMVWMGASAAVLAAAAALVLALIPQGTPAPMPSYRLESSVGEMEVRGEAADQPVLRVVRGTRIRLVAHPELALQGEFEAKAFALTASTATEITARIERDPSGAVLFLGTVGKELALPSGTNAIWLAIARPGQMPAASELPNLIRNAGQPPRPGLVLLGQPLEMSPP